ncbi:MAG: outer membrane lipoprotein chaperone LolA [Alcanivorax sp.]|uniref:Outer-membrane lipoprotein carrier protein n=1 Tax=Alloalcanivorax marinus TaxID=1177169 RepID=A0A9Q3UNH3_9GAMM|nr:outer membrane lipoprotein chaperone LolA [Alloalcanivorax marinus]MBM7335609.1 outer membrane lipoprotein chaperone LolA [Alloalcanivorax marinus]MCC4308978.1 outer membrane lipoprotein chaperone LolA [Alloalcanivorax marinus]MCU5788048.1 outer membrane lipoprotein carrier protein [Alloalcanivorax marinus]
MRLFWIIALLLPSLALAGPTEDLLARLGGLHSLAGGFQQTVVGEGGERARDSAGTMEVARGNRFYWHTERPYEQLAVSDGRQVWVYDPDLEQVVVRPLTQDLGQTPALLFGGDPQAVSRAFSISEQSRDGNRVTYRLKPKGGDPLFDTLDVTFDGDEPRSMRLEDALGQKTIIDFRDLTLNGEPTPGRFQFEPPEGTDVIRQQ